MLAKIFEHHIIDHTVAVLRVAGFSLPITKHLLMMWLSGGFLMIAVPALARARSPRFALGRSLVEAVAAFVRNDIVLPNMGEAGLVYTEYFCTLFTFILVCNFIGLVPFGATATGNISVTAALALSTLALIIFSGLREQGLAGYLKSFVPSGVPGWLAPMIFPIELISLAAKTFALCIRLFANMIAGHFVILSLFGLIFIFGAISPVADWTLTVPAAVGMALFVSLLEVLVAVLQAYIFTFLTAIFAGMAMHPH
ncbi:MAG: F0F1 ATP synthase subunit A [Elusimicrobiales bacterium]